MKMLAERTERGWKLTLPLCPSTNERMVPQQVGWRARRRFTGRLIKSVPARRYMKSVGRELTTWAQRVGFRPIDKYFFLEYEVTVASPAADAHNYDKIMFDTLELGGIVKNDRYIVPRMSMPVIDPKDPKIVVYLPFN